MAEAPCCEPGGGVTTPRAVESGVSRPAAVRPATRRPSLLPYAGFATLALIWGSSFLFIKVAVQELSPEVVVLGRCVAATLALGAVMAVRRRSPFTASNRRRLSDYLVMAVGYSLVPWFCLAYGELTVSSGLAAILNSTSPLWTAILAWWLTPTERPRSLNYLGVAVGMAGTVLLVSPDLVQHGVTATTLGVAAVLVVALAYAAGAVYQRRRLRDADPFEATFWQLVLAAIIAAPLALPPLLHSRPGWPSVGSVVLLGVVSSGIGLVLYFWLLNRLGAARASSVNYLLPVVALAWGALFLDEIVALGTLAATAVILGGVLLAGWPSRRRSVQPAGSHDAG